MLRKVALPLVAASALAVGAPLATATAADNSDSWYQSHEYHHCGGYWTYYRVWHPGYWDKWHHFHKGYWEYKRQWHWRWCKDDHGKDHNDNGKDRH